MKVGFPNNPRRDILEEIEWIGKNKFDFVDLFLEEVQVFFVQTKGADHEGTSCH